MLGSSGPEEAAPESETASESESETASATEPESESVTESVTESETATATEPEADSERRIKTCDGTPSSETPVLPYLLFVRTESETESETETVATVEAGEVVGSFVGLAIVPPCSAASRPSAECVVLAMLGCACAWLRAAHSSSLREP